MDPTFIWPHRRMKATFVGFSLVFTTGNSEAFQMCPTGTRPCAEMSQMLSYLLAPSLVFLLAIVSSRRCLGRTWIRRATVRLLLVAWAVWLIGVGAAFDAFLAPCSSACWHGDRTAVSPRAK